MTCDANEKITSVDAQWTGNVHDSKDLATDCEWSSGRVHVNAYVTPSDGI